MAPINSPLIDFSVPDIEFQIDGIDFAPYLASLNVSPGIADRDSPYVWRGDFEVAFPWNADISEDEFDEDQRPARWRRGQSRVYLRIYGIHCLSFRIDSYAYLNRRGKGKLTQSIELAKQRTTSGTLSLTIGEQTKIDTVVATLVDKSFTFATFPDGVSKPTLGGQLGTPDVTTVDFISDSPIGDAQKLAGLYWNWITCTRDESFQLKRRPYAGQSNADYELLFQRSLRQVLIQPNDEPLTVAPAKCTVVGSRQVAKPYPEDDGCESDIDKAGDNPTEAQQQGLDDQGRPRKTVTTTEQAFNIVFPGQGSANPIVAERKTIVYRYLDGEDVTLFSADLSMLTPDILAKIAECKRVRGTGNEVACVVTIVERPAGSIFPALGTNTTLYPYSVTVEGQDLKAEYYPAGLVYPSVGTDFALILSKQESIEQGLALPQRVSQEDIDPRTGKPKKKECRPKQEPRQDAPEFRLETQTFKGVAEFQGKGWAEFTENEIFENVGYCPSQACADNLAMAIGTTQWMRNRSYLVEMPIPFEYIDARCPAFPVVLIHKYALLVDEPIISIEGGKARFGFTGELMGKLDAVQDPEIPPPYVPTYSTALAALPTGTIGLRVGIAAVPAQLAATGGTGLYTWSGSLPAGLTLQADGTITGTPTASGTYTPTLTVTDAALNTATITPTIEVLARPTLTPDLDFVLPVELGIELGMATIETIVQLYGADLGFELGMQIDGIFAGQPIGFEVGMEATVEAGGSTGPTYALVHSYPFDSNYNDATGSVNLTASGSTSIVAGFTNNCVQMLRNAKVQTTAPGTLYPDTTKAFKLDLYFQMTSVLDFAYLVKMESAANYIVYALSVSGSGVQFEVQGSDFTTYSAVDSTTSLSGSTWYHVVAEWIPNTSISVKVDANPAATSSHSIGIIASAADETFGCYGITAGIPTNFVKVDEFKFYQEV